MTPLVGRPLYKSGWGTPGSSSRRGIKGSSLYNTIFYNILETRPPRLPQQQIVCPKTARQFIPVSLVSQNEHQAHVFISSIAYIHVHNAGPGCYSWRIDRA